MLEAEETIFELLHDCRYRREVPAAPTEFFIVEDRTRIDWALQQYCFTENVSCQTINYWPQYRGRLRWASDRNTAVDYAT
jgi:hypothetical protein